MEKNDFDDVSLEDLIYETLGISDCTDINALRMSVTYDLGRLMDSFKSRIKLIIDGYNKEIDSLKLRLAEIDKELTELEASKRASEPEEELTSEPITEDKQPSEEIVSDELPKEELTTEELPEEDKKGEEAPVQNVEIDDSINEKIRELKKDRTTISDRIDKLTKDIVKEISREDSYQRRYEGAIAEIDSTTDLEQMLRKCIAYKTVVLQSIDAKSRRDDSQEVLDEKIARRSKALKLSMMLRKMPSISDYILERRERAKHVDEKTTIVFNKSLPRTSRHSYYPFNKLDIRFVSGPKGLPDEYGKVLEEAGIYTYVFGTVTHSTFPNEHGRYTQEFTRKDLVAIVKKDEFNELQTYAVMMDSFNSLIPPEFYRDVLFSDTVLRNAENNLGYVGESARDPKDKKYGYKVAFEGIGMEDFMRALYFENNPDVVKITSNYPRVKSVAEAREIMIKKVREALERLYDRSTDDKDKGNSIGEN